MRYNPIEIEYERKKVLERIQYELFDIGQIRVIKQYLSQQTKNGYYAPLKAKDDGKPNKLAGNNLYNITSECAWEGYS